MFYLETIKKLWAARENVFMYGIYMFAKLVYFKAHNNVLIIL